MTRDNQEIESINKLKTAVGALGTFAGTSAGNRELRTHMARLDELLRDLEEDLSVFDVHGSSSTAGTMIIRLEAVSVDKKTEYRFVTYEGARADSEDRFTYKRTLEILGNGETHKVVRKGLAHGSWHVTVSTEDGWSASKDVEIRAGEETDVFFERGDVSSAPVDAKG